MCMRRTFSQCGVKYVLAATQGHVHMPYTFSHMGKKKGQERNMHFITQSISKFLHCFFKIRLDLSDLLEGFQVSPIAV